MIPLNENGKGKSNVLQDLLVCRLEEQTAQILDQGLEIIFAGGQRKDGRDQILRQLGEGPKRHDIPLKGSEQMWEALEKRHREGFVGLATRGIPLSLLGGFGVFI
jgi:hypothetical protein